MEYVAIVVVLLILQYSYFGYAVGSARVTTGTKAPSMDGPPEFMAAFRVHQNTGEMLLAVYPAMLVCAYFAYDWLAAAGGLVFLLSRFWYRAAYLKDAGRRGAPFIIGFAAMMIMAFGGLIGAVADLL